MKLEELKDADKRKELMKDREKLTKLAFIVLVTGVAVFVVAGYTADFGSGIWYDILAGIGQGAIVIAVLMLLYTSFLPSKKHLDKKAKVEAEKKAESEPSPEVKTETQVES